jgi:hypothetical protein
MRRCLFVLALALLADRAMAQPPDDSRTSIRGYVAAEPRIFPQGARFPGQDSFNPSIAAGLEVRREWDRRTKSLVVTPFLRFDQSDSARTHVDLREASFRLATDKYDLLVGVSKVFWGVTESQHLVDIVNQTDLVENPDGEDKLGQLMVNLALTRAWGTLNLFVLPGARERTFPGDKGRFRTPVRVDTDAAVFEGGRWHTDVAARWSKTISVVDLGVSHFYGTSREPRLVPEARGPDEVRLVPHYDLINQTGVDAQMTVGQWLWKVEAIERSGQGPRYAAVTAGFEYTIANVGGSGTDVGLLAEYLYDERGSRATTPWQDDVFAGVRLARGDAQSTELLAGVIVDRKSGARAWTVEASRRVSGNAKLGVEARFFNGSKPGDPLSAIQHDDYVQVAFSYHF